MGEMTEIRRCGIRIGLRREMVSSLGAAVILLLLIAYPFFVRSYLLSLGVEVLAFAIFAISLNLLLGYTGLVSFGHAAFFGLGTYLLALGAIHLTPNLLVTLPLVILGTGIAAVLLGILALRTSGIYFLMITLAFAQMLYSIAIRWTNVTGGSDGLAGVPTAMLAIGPLSYTFGSRISYYYLVLCLFLVIWWLVRRMVESPFGWTLRGIRENEARMAALGYNTFRYKLLAFVIAGVLAGIAGALIANFFWYASPENLHWSMSGQVITMLIIGGAGTLPGPVVGAAIVRLLPLFTSSLTERWPTIQGIIFIVFVLFAPQGLMGILHNLKQRWKI
jgi:branched-chain amino acid transport system permease protein